jgi:archaeosine synthase beta-subunit
MGSLYPAAGTERDAWILDQRPPRATLNLRQPYAFFVEDERSAEGAILPVATVFLTNRECPWRCVMCDLWRNTLMETVPLGAIPEQIDFALDQLPPARAIKLYNSGSFFDPRAIPVEDYAAIAERLNSFERIVVECHPSLVSERCLTFRDLLRGNVEVAMGLETAHPGVLEKLNKHMTLAKFEEAAGFLRRNRIDLRVFILLQPPFMLPEESLYWAQRSLALAFDCGATAASLIPTRGGNGAMESLMANGDFMPPPLKLVEDAMSYGLNLNRGRVFVDLWDLRRTPGCAQCYIARIARLQAINLQQTARAPIPCDLCGGLS